MTRERRADSREYLRTMRAQPTMPEELAGKPKLNGHRWRPLLERRAGECLWPKDLADLDKRAKVFCCAPVVGDTSYCAEHLEIAVVRRT